jgi:anti-sigma B factor antagonist
VEISTDIVAGVAIIHLSNRVNSSVGEELTSTVNRLLDEGHLEFVVRLEPVSSIDSAALGDIVRAYTTVRRRGGSLKLEGLDQLLRDILGLTKLRRSFETSGAAVAGGVLFLVIVVIIWMSGGALGIR